MVPCLYQPPRDQALEAAASPAPVEDGADGGDEPGESAENDSESNGSDHDEEENSPGDLDAVTLSLDGSPRRGDLVPFDKSDSEIGHDGSDGESEDLGNDMPNLPADSRGNTSFGFNLACLGVPPVPPMPESPASSETSDEDAAQLVADMAKLQTEYVTPKRRAPVEEEPPSVIKKAKKSSAVAAPAKPEKIDKSWATAAPAKPEKIDTAAPAKSSEKTPAATWRKNF